MALEPTLPLVYGAGVISSASPCVLPVLPPLLGLFMALPALKERWSRSLGRLASRLPAAGAARRSGSALGALALADSWASLSKNRDVRGQGMPPAIEKGQG